MYRRISMALSVALVIFAAPTTSLAENVPLEKTALPAGPVANTKITEEYARLVARDIFFWAWPMVNVYNRRLTFKDMPKAGLMGGIVPVGPPNRLSMLTDYIEPQERLVACPNQDVVYGFSLLALDQSPIVVQVPDFGDRFWVYQVVDLRTDSFVQFGKMYGTKPGFYLLVGPNWTGQVPKGITKVFRSTTSTGVLIPRVFQDDNAADKKAVQAAIAGVDLYPLAEFDGTMKRRDWAALPKFPSQEQGEAETKWVVPDKIFDVLPAVLKDAPPLPGEAARYEEALSVVAAAQKNPDLKKAMIDEATKADKDWRSRCCNSATSAFSFHIIGARSRMVQRSAPTISRVLPWESPTSS